MDRVADEDARDLRKRNSELERELRHLQRESAIFRKATIALLLLLAIVSMWAADLGLDANLKASVAAYEVADRCTRECDCSRIGLDQ